jgi:two-component system, chemotaxis family, protein-glutamate methylesterase/glutaminase
MSKNFSKFTSEALKRKIRCIVMGTSAGGVEALAHLLPHLKKPSPLSVAIVIHLPHTGPNLIPSLLMDQCEFSIKEAVPWETLEKETIYLAPPNYHLSIESDLTLSLSNEEPVCYSRPSINVLFDSAAEALNERVVGFLLTGANEDGAMGMKKIQERGGLTVVENPLTAHFPAMPQSVLNIMTPDLVSDIFEMKKLLEVLSTGAGRE